MGVELVDDAIGLGSYPVLSGGKKQHICPGNPESQPFIGWVWPSSQDAIVANKGLVDRDSRA